MVAVQSNITLLNLSELGTGRPGIGFHDAFFTCFYLIKRLKFKVRAKKNRR